MTLENECFIHSENLNGSSRQVRQRRTFCDNAPPNEALTGHECFIHSENLNGSSRQVRQRRTFCDDAPPNEALAGHECFIHSENLDGSSRQVRQRRTFCDDAPPNEALTGHEFVLSDTCSRRMALKRCAAGLLATGAMAWLDRSTLAAPAETAVTIKPRPWVKIRGTYGGFPQATLSSGKSPVNDGINAIWVGSGGLKAAEIARCHDLGLKVYAEFNSMHFAAFLKDHPDAAPIGPDGQPSPPPHGWQGVSPFHAGYRKNRMDEFRRVLETFEIDGIWLDYHHAHASWERADPLLPDTDFCPVALDQFTQKTGIPLPGDLHQASRLLLGKHRDQWTQFRCDVFTDWVREYRDILNAVRPGIVLGTFHCPWSPEDHDGAIRHQLAIDLPAQARFIDIFSIMPYHARFGFVRDPAWIARQTKRLGELLNIRGTPEESKKIWPIVQLADWEEPVPAEQIPEILDYGTRLPATGVTVFHLRGVLQQAGKADLLRKTYQAMQGTDS